MECGVPFCHHGCPLGNLIPDWNDLVYRDHLARGDRPAPPHEQLPGVHGPALPRALRGGVRARDPRGRCRHDQADRGLDRRTAPGTRAGSCRGRRAAERAHRGGDRLGAGRPRLCAAARTRAGHSVTVYERDERRAGSSASASPSSRSRSGSSSGACSSSSTRASRSATASMSASISSGRAPGSHDAVVVATGARVPRDLPVPGRELDGVHFAMEYLYERDRFATRTPRRPSGVISAAGKHVIVIGGGDTGADCVGNAHREQRRLGDPDRAGRRASALPARRPHPLAALADEAPRLVRAERGRRARVLDQHHPLQRQRTRRSDPLGSQQRCAAVRAGRGNGRDAAGRPRAARDGLSRARAARAGATRRRARPALERRGALRTRPRPTESSPPATRAGASR